MNEQISIIVPVYKVEKWLDRCVQSIVDQTYDNLEIILVDDGSPDNCPQICDRWAQRDNRIKVIHKENGGPSAARNIALDVAKGSFLGFVDSDDYIDPNLCERIMELFQQHDVDIITFDCCRITEKGKALGGTEKIRKEILSPEAALVELMQGHINNYACNKVYKRQVFQDIRFPEKNVCEDMAIMYKLFLKADRVYCFPERLYYYMQRNNSLTAVMNENALCDIYTAKRDRYLYLKEIFPAVGDLGFGQVALSARRIYDRSLWADLDPVVLENAQAFLIENRERILDECTDIAYRMYYSFPGIYKLLRLGKHWVGNILKTFIYQK